MAIADIGMGTGDFMNNEFLDLGTSITHVIATGTADFRGNITYIFSGTSTKTAVFHKRTQAQERGKEGAMLVAPAYLMHPIGSGISAGDKVIVGTGTGSVWKVYNVVNREGVCNWSELYLYE